MSAEILLCTTGEVARRLGVSRQHIVDLCDQGALPCVMVGSHRRI
ncbi:MAG: DNA-binding protein, partial [Mycobacterium sp.]